VALLVAAALQSGERKPSVAFVNLDHSGRTVLVGKKRVSVEQYAQRLSNEVDLKRLGPAEARAALDDGRVSAILTIPPDFITKLQAGRPAPPPTPLPRRPDTRPRDQPAGRHPGGRHRPPPPVGCLPAEPGDRRQLRAAGGRPGDRHHRRRPPPDRAHLGTRPGAPPEREDRAEHARQL